MPPAKPKLVNPTGVEYATWNQFVSEATDSIKPYGLVLPGDAEPTIFPCPTGAQMEALGLAQANTSDHDAFVALFGTLAERLLELTASLPFTVRAKLIQAIMMHYGLQIEALPES